MTGLVESAVDSEDDELDIEEVLKLLYGTINILLFVSRCPEML